jgi:hypothetical protein
LSRFVGAAFRYIGVVAGSICTSMKNYESLRRVWAFELEHRGEVGRLAPLERDLLQRGSLEVFCASRLARLERGVLALRAGEVLSGVVAVIALASLLVGQSALFRDLVVVDVLPRSVPVLLALLFGSLAGAALCAVLHGRLVRRRAIYRTMGAATAHVMAAR